MGCNIVVGGQYGSEGKGKVVALLAEKCEEPWVVRCGGPNSGHTIDIGANEFALRQVPAGAGHLNAVLCIAAGSVIDLDLLTAEADSLRIPRNRLIVDPRAVVMVPADRELEKRAVPRIASTASGTGAAIVRRIQRESADILAGSSERLRDRFTVKTVAPLIHAQLSTGGDVIVEGTQGFGLSLLHGPHYPFVTARDTTASGFASEVGLSPRHVDNITVVVRTFPIRVGGNSGPLAEELTWEKVQELSGAPVPYPEYTTVTKRLRRVGLFDLELVKHACAYNGATALAVMGLDRLDYKNVRATDPDQLTEKTRIFIKTLIRETGVSIAWGGTGFGTRDAIDFAPTRNI